MIHTGKYSGWHEKADHTGKAPEHKAAATKNKLSTTSRTPMVGAELDKIDKTDKIDPEEYSYPEIKPGSSSFHQQLINFSLDEDGKNRWRFSHYIYAPNPALFSDPNPFQYEAWLKGGFGGCRACGHSPIVHHYFVTHPTKGTFAVGSECIKQILNVQMDKAIKTITNRTIRNYNNKAKLKGLLDKYETFFSQHPDILKIATGFYNEWYVRYGGNCKYDTSIFGFIDAHKNCSDFMGSAYRYHSSAQVEAVEQYGCKVCKQDYNKWKEKAPVKPVKECPDITVKTLADVPPVIGCDDPTHCMKLEFQNPEISGQEILSDIRKAYERNYKDIDFIYNNITNFNKWGIKQSAKIYSGNVPIEIPIFTGRDFKKEPLSLSEEIARGKATADALAEMGK